MPTYRVYWEHKLHDNGPEQPALINAKDEDEAAKIFERDNPQCYTTHVELADETDD